MRKHIPEKWPRNRLAGEPTDDIKKTRVGANGMVAPGITRHLRGGTDGIVTAGGGIEVDGIEGVQIRLADSDAIEAGTEVRVWRGRGAEWAKPKEYVEAEDRVTQRLSRFQSVLKDRWRGWLQDRGRAGAEAFWSQYDLPVEVDIAIKGRLSGLTRNSWGDGRASTTVEHGYVREAVSDGRFEREANSYLCDPNANPSFRFDEDTERTDSDGVEYTPPVTCQKCLKRMERWRVVDEDEVAVEQVWERQRPEPAFRPVPQETVCA